MAFQGFKGFFGGFIKKSSATFGTFIRNFGIEQRQDFDIRAATIESYMRNPIVYACITMVAEQAAHLPFEVFVGDKKQDNHPLLTLLNNPNPQEAKDFFFEKVYSYLQINGNSYVEAAYSDRTLKFRESAPDWLYSLRPDRISIIPGKNFIPQFYKFNNNGNNVLFEVTVLGKSNILQLKKFHPHNDYMGMSPLMPAAWSVDQHNRGSAWNLSQMKNGAQPSGILQFDGELTEEQKKEFTKVLDNRFSGDENANRSMVLGGGMKWSQTSLSPKDMDFLELKKASAADTALTLGVPLVLLNTEQAKFENIQASNEQLWSNTVLPLVNNLIMEFNMWLSPRYGKDVRIGVDLSKVPVLMNRRNRQLEALNNINFLTVNEKRGIVGKEPVDGGDDILIELNKTPLNTISFPPIVENKKELGKHLIKSGYTQEQTGKIIKLVNQ